MKIIDGHNVTVMNKTGYLSSLRQTLIEVQFGTTARVKIQAYVTSTVSEFKLEFIIIQRGLYSGGHKMS